MLIQEGSVTLYADGFHTAQPDPFILFMLVQTIAVRNQRDEAADGRVVVPGPKLQEAGVRVGVASAA